MKYSLRWSVCVLFTLTAYAGESPSPAPASSSDAAACKASDFSSYWSRFVEDSEFQRQTTKSPLEKLAVDNTALPGPTPVESSSAPSAKDFPVLPSPAQIKASGLTLENIKTDRGMQVRLQKPDTDYLVYYFFEREPCWRLVRIENWSL